MSENEGVVFPAHSEIELTSKPMPELGPNEVRIKTECTLVSIGTELARLTASLGAEDPFPFHPGYNNIGTIVEVGEEVDDRVIGDRVGTYGSHQQYVVTGYDGCHPVPADVDPEAAVYFTIGEIVMNGIRRSGLQFGEVPAVFGLGLLGQLTVRLCHLAGGHPVFGLDIATERLDYLPDSPAVHGANPDSETYLETIEAETAGRLADVAFEVTGIPEVIPDTFEVLDEQGRMVVLGSPRGTTEFDFNGNCHNPGHVIIGAHNGTHPATATAQNPWTRPRHVELFFELVRAGRLQPTELTTHRLPYREAPETYETLLDDRTQSLGVVFEWQ